MGLVLVILIVVMLAIGANINEGRRHRARAYDRNSKLQSMFGVQYLHHQRRVKNR
jgi:hypothetical protein